MCAPAISAIEADLSITSSVASTLAVTIYVLGIAIGPMFTSPLSEIYGRTPVYHAASLVFVAFVIGNALSKNLAQFLVFRFISGCAGGTPMALGGGTIADITTIETRAVAMALFSMGPLAGPVSQPLEPYRHWLMICIIHTGSRASHRWLCRSRTRLALDVLVAVNPGGSRWRDSAAHPARNASKDHSRAQGCPSPCEYWSLGFALQTCQ